MSILFGRGRSTEARAINPVAAFGAGYDPQRGMRDPMALVPLFAAHRIILDAVSATPLERFRQNSDGTKTQITGSSLFRGVDDTGFSFTSQCVSSLLYDGNAIGYVTGYDFTGWPSDMVWLDPRRVAVEGGLGDPENPTARPTYFYDRKLLDPTRVLHIPWIAAPGKARALSPLANFKVTFETGAHAQQLARDFYKNNGVPSAHVKNTALQLDDEAVAQKIKERYKADVAGRDVVVTGADWEITPLGLPPDQTAFVATLKLTATQIAAIYGVPPEEVGGETGSSMTYKTLEQQEQRFYGRVVRPWATRIEEYLSTLLPRGQYVRFNLDAQVRADLLTRYQAHAIGLSTGVETLDEARAVEERPPLTPEELQQWQETYGSQPLMTNPANVGGQSSDPGGTPNGH